MPTLSTWYTFLTSSGVNEEWASIGTVILACLCVYTILKVFLTIIKAK